MPRRPRPRPSDLRGSPRPRKPSRWEVRRRSAIAETGNVSQSTVTSTTQIVLPRGQSQSLTPGSQPSLRDLTRRRTPAHTDPIGMQIHAAAVLAITWLEGIDEKPVIGARDLVLFVSSRALDVRV